MNETPTKYITVLNYPGKILFVLSGDTPVGIKNASVRLVFLISNGMVKMFLKSNGKEKKQA